MRGLEKPLSLWTPSGEHEVGRQAPTRPTGDAEPQGDDWRERLTSGEIDLEDLTPEQRAEVEEVVGQLAAAQQQLLTTPIEHMIAQHAVGLRELALLHLQQAHPDFRAAKLAIDAIGGMLQATSSQLGELGEPLTRDLQQLQMMFVSAHEAFTQQSTDPAEG